MDFRAAVTSNCILYGHLASSSDPSPLLSGSAGFPTRMQTRSQKRRRSPSGTEPSKESRPSKKRTMSGHSGAPVVAEHRTPPAGPLPQWSSSTSIFTPRRLGSPLESTFSGPPSPVPSVWAPSDTDYNWNALREESGVQLVHPDFLQATQDMRIEDPGGADVDADMDGYNDEQIPVPAISIKEFTIPTLHLQPPTPLLYESPSQSNVPRSPSSVVVPASQAVCSMTQDNSPLLPRKRFTMGPREGCEKCRLKIPGHYGHLD